MHDATYVVPCKQAARSIAFNEGSCSSQDTRSLRGRGRSEIWRAAERLVEGPVNCFCRFLAISDWGTHSRVNARVGFFNKPSCSQTHSKHRSAEGRPRPTMLRHRGPTRMLCRSTHRRRWQQTSGRGMPRHWLQLAHRFDEITQLRYRGGTRG
jgi:hypothetical protein